MILILMAPFRVTLILIGAWFLILMAKIRAIFKPGKAKRIATGFNNYGFVSGHQYGGTADIVFSRLAAYVLESKTDLT